MLNPKLICAVGVAALLMSGCDQRPFLGWKYAIKTDQISNVEYVDAEIIGYRDGYRSEADFVIRVEGQPNRRSVNMYSGSMYSPCNSQGLAIIRIDSSVYDVNCKFGRLSIEADITSEFAEEVINAHEIVLANGFGDADQAAIIRVRKSLKDILESKNKLSLLR